MPSPHYQSRKHPVKKRHLGNRTPPGDRKQMTSQEYVRNSTALREVADWDKAMEYWRNRRHGFYNPYGLDACTFCGLREVEH